MVVLEARVFALIIKRRIANAARKQLKKLSSIQRFTVGRAGEGTNIAQPATLQDARARVNNTDFKILSRGRRAIDTMSKGLLAGFRGSAMCGKTNGKRVLSQKRKLVNPCGFLIDVVLWGSVGGPS